VSDEPIPRGDAAADPADGPLALIRAWLPHLLLVGLVLAAVWLIVVVIAPLRVPLLLAGATAVLTAPVLFHPCLRLTRHCLPRLGDGLQRQIAAICATVALVGVVVSPVLLLLLSLVNSFGEGWQLLLGLALQDQARLEPFFVILQAQITSLAALYPGLQLDPQGIILALQEILAASKSLGPTFLSFLFKGSGRVAEVGLALVCLSFFYANGPQLLRMLLDLSPLDERQQQLLIERHDRVAEHILVSSLGTACVKGLFFGGIAWLSGIPVPPPLIVLVAGVLSLLPMVGLTMVWLPLSLLAWSRGDHGLAVVIALLSLLSNYGFDHLRRRYRRARGLPTEGWMNFGLFIGLVGGLLAFGLPGLVIGPVAVAMATVLTRYGLPLYSASATANKEAEGRRDSGSEGRETPPTL
jgi:predicted PurR-regulated permease PerM